MSSLPTSPSPEPSSSGVRLAVGIDLGTTNTKVALVTIGNDEIQVRALASAPTPEPADLPAVLRELLQRVLAGSSAPDVVGIASMAETGVPLDVHGRPLGPWLRWDSHQAGVQARRLADRLGAEQLTRATGVRPSAKVPLATWAWMRANRPAEWSAMHTWAGVADLGCRLLTGRLATDHTLAGRTMAYRLPAGGAPVPAAFDPDLLAEVGLRPEQLPTVVPPGEIAGRVSDPAFTSCGLRPGTPVIIAGHDHAVGAYACGVREPGDVADSLGTSEAVLSVVAGTPDPVAAGRAGMSTVVTVRGRHQAILAGSPAAGATIAWWLAHEADGFTLDELFQQVLASPDRPGDVIVLPYLSGRQTPDPDPTARLRVLGRRPEHTAVELARAMLEGLCLQARWMLQAQARLAGPDDGAITSVTLFGGAVTAIPAWVRIKAHVLPWPIRVVPAAEPVAVGAALLAAARTARNNPAQPGTDEAAVPALDRHDGPVVPGAGVDYDRAFARFVAAATTIEHRAHPYMEPQGDDVR